MWCRACPLPLATLALQEEANQTKCTLMYSWLHLHEYLLFELCLLFSVLHLLFCSGPLCVCGERVGTPRPGLLLTVCLVIVCLGFALFQFCGFVSF